MSKKLSEVFIWIAIITGGMFLPISSNAQTATTETKTAPAKLPSVEKVNINTATLE